MKIDAVRELGRIRHPRHKPSLRAYRPGSLWIVSVPVWVADPRHPSGGFYRWTDIACRTWGEGFRVIDHWWRNREPTGRVGR